MLMLSFDPRLIYCTEKSISVSQLLSIFHPWVLLQVRTPFVQLAPQPALLSAYAAVLTTQQSLQHTQIDIQDISSFQQIQKVGMRKRNVIYGFLH